MKPFPERWADSSVLKREWDVASEHVWDAPARQSTAASVSARKDRYWREVR